MANWQQMNSDAASTYGSMSPEQQAQAYTDAKRKMDSLIASGLSGDALVNADPQAATMYFGGANFSRTQQGSPLAQTISSGAQKVSVAPVMANMLGSVPYGSDVAKTSFNDQITGKGMGGTLSAMLPYIAVAGAGAGLNALSGAGAGTAGAGTAGAGTAGTGATVGATEAAGGAGLLSQIGDWANETSAATGGSGNALSDLVSFGKNNLGQLVTGGAAAYNASQQGKAAEDIAAKQFALQKPYYDAGTAALGKMSGGFGAYEQDPYNKFLQEQGQQGVERSMAAKRMLGSGNTLAELAKYNQGIAGAGYQDWFNNQGAIAGFGAPAASNMGNAYAGGRQGAADSTSGVTGSLAEMFNNIYNNPNKATAPTQKTWQDYAGLNAGSGQTPGINPSAFNVSNW